MWRRLFIISMVLAVSMLLVTVPLWATDCAQEELTGAWDARIGATDEFGGPCWDTANLTIGASGIVEAGTYFDCNTGASAQITGGSLAYTASCEIEGYIQTATHTIDLHSGAIVGNQGHLSFGRREN